MEHAGFPRDLANIVQFRYQTFNKELSIKFLNF